MTHFTTPLAYRRRPTRVVRVGGVGIGGGEPIRIQSMLTCGTWDVERVIAETRELVEAGCEIVRLTVPTQKDLDALPAIRRRMEQERLRVPLVADIHFNPRLALGCVPWVEKVRINPGNYVDSKRFAVREYTDAEYAAELARIEEALVPLIRALRRHGRALRVGVNHGSLSDRILNRHGDTSEGMVECALEYLRVLARHGFHDTVLSMKSSNPLVVIQAYRLLTLRMAAEGMDYPLHLGVTEAGDGADGRIKSAIGIGSLLCDGLGDTIRVSLTEPSRHEIPAARELVAALERLRTGPAWPETAFRAPIDVARRATRRVSVGPVAVGGGERVAFFALADGTARLPAQDGPFDAELAPPAERAAELGAGGPGGGSGLRLVSPREAVGGDAPALVRVEGHRIESRSLADLLRRGRDFPQGALLLLHGPHLLFPLRRLVDKLAAAGLDWPVGVMLPPVEAGGLPLGVAAEVGSLAADGLLDAVVCPTAQPDAPATAFSTTLLQAARLRTYKTEYISCPSCGRTLFDLQETTARIKARTSHLKGVKIAVMGCIVNGPGEMADADFGYVGGAPGKVNLYRGKECVERAVPTKQAVERLVAVIRESGRWVEA
jgi:(E)-4-hydroxy-3-methylbut-2-enyl-diphosphate synthase